ncbi:MAG: hypothetical protein JWO13_475 [Acidobacteriales bacterium]|nr:hypothetical protein [Terriglobales bacterium]
MDRNRENGCGKSSPSQQLRTRTSLQKRNWKPISLASIVVCFLIVCTGCGGSSASSSTDPVTIVISPTTVTLPVSTSQQFSVSIGNSTNTNVTWQVNGTTGGSATFGTISTGGLYTAPSSVPATAITVTAIAQADTTKTATTTVTVSNSTKIVVSPAQSTIAAGGQQTFSATLGGQVVSATWSLSCQNATAGACGTVSQSGIYTAPLSPPPGQSVSVVASSTNNTANAGNANVVVTFGSGTLFGQYSFGLAGLDAGQPFSSAGSITFDGKGGITGGIEDVHGKGAPITITGGTYVSGADGRATATVHTSSGDEGWEIVFVNHARALVTRVDSVIARGELDAQDSLQFGKSLNGALSFQLAGSTGSAIPVSAMLGGLTLDAQGNITSGALDSNNGGTLSTNVPVSGNSSISSSDNGRGTLTLTSSLGTQQFAYYVVSSASAKLLEIDGLRNLSGTLGWRTSTTTAANYSGAYAFIFSGANSQGAVGQGGTFSADANGNVTSGTFDLSTDTTFGLGFLFAGSFVVSDPAIGRTIATFNVGGSTLQYVVYPPNLNNEIAFLEIDNQNVTSGTAFRQSSISSNGSAPSISGQFAFGAGETSAVVREAISGIISPAAAATGTLDLNNNGNITLGTSLQSSQFSVTSLSGRGSLLLQAGSYKASYTTYILDNNNVLMLQTDGKGVLSGTMRRQY